VHEQAAAQVKGLLKNLPNQIRTARGRLSNLKSTARATVMSNQINAALYLVQELNRAVEALGKLIDPKHEEELVQQLSAHQQRIISGKDDVTQKTAACEQLRRDLATAEHEYQSKAEAREAAIKAKLDALPEVQDKPSTAADDAPTPALKEKPAESLC
jgi:hypothetical protein